MVLAALAADAPDHVLFIARDEPRMMATAQALAFFAPEAEVLVLPPWDCLPYDRVSPNPEVCAQRLQSLGLLAADAAANGPRIVLTTVSAALQRVPTRTLLGGAGFAIETKQQLDQRALQTFLAGHGYRRAGTVREAGEYAVRGGIIDIFAPGADVPVRLDLFGDTLESLRRFDPLTQRTTEDIGRLQFGPVGEVTLDEAAIARFRAGYSALFGVATDDPLYEAVTAGRHHIGMEHWMPLFHEALETVFDYVPAAVVCLDHHAEEVRDTRLATIQDHHRARTSGEADGSEIPYRPLPPDRLYLDAREWDACLAERSVALLSPFAAPDGEARLDAGGRPGRDFGPARLQPEVNVFDAVKEHIAALHAGGRRAIVAGFSVGARDRLASVLGDHGLEPATAVASWAEAERLTPGTVALAVLGIERGFETENFAVIGEQDILGDRIARPPRRSRRAEHFITEISNLNPGDLVVHVDHGIGRYEGLQTIDVGEAPHDCLWLTYDGGDRLFVPVENIEMLSRYGSEEALAALDKLGGGAWQARKARAKKRIKDMAAALVKVAADRAIRTVAPLPPPAGLYEEFCARFPYHETDDQAGAIDDVLGDLAAGKPLDRLICGDVGFGKTEVALRSAFIVAYTGKQVAVVTPTTLLCRQHYQTFCERFADLPIRVGRLSRLVPPREAAETRRGLASGEVDIVIGTHALLGKQINFRRLALVIVDEEQRFGVAHKERLKSLRSDVHVLTLTATPIPRTLQMAMSGVRDLSLIATPPVDRLAVRTFVMPFDTISIREAVLREHYRGGQTFFVCPRIADLPDSERFLKEKVPEVKYAIAHGQLPARDLDATMQAFYDHQFDVLISTNIIESGLDIPAANTLVIWRADRFGLAQLYQLRGRIGRAKVRAYAYLTLPPRRIPTATAERRLQVLQALDELGAGFSLASHDLDIRGAGNLLGSEQSGHIREVGFELYQQMLEEAVASLRARTDGEGAIEEHWSPQIGIGASVLIPENYVDDLTARLGLYRRLSRLETTAEIDAMAAELVDRFGPLPEEVEHLLEVVAIKQHCRAAGIDKIEAGARGATVSFRNNSFANPAGLVEFIGAQAGTAKLRLDHRLVIKRNWDDEKSRLKGVRLLAERLAAVAVQGAGATASASGPALARVSASKT